MRLFHIFICILVSVSIFAQVNGDMNAPCKPISEMMGHYDRLAKAALREGIWDNDVHYYDLDIAVDIDTEIINGSVEVLLSSEVDDLETIELDFADDMTVDSVYLNGANYTHNSNIITITLDGNYDAGEEFTVGISYHGHPLQNGFQAFEFGHQYGEEHRTPMISTLSEPYGARTWWPCKDVPTDKADSVKITLTVDNAYTAVSNGLLTSQTLTMDGNTIWVWEHKYPIATYLVSLAITEYTYWSEMHHFADGDSMPLEYWMYPSFASDANVYRWNLTGNMIDIFSELYGKYPFAKEKYGMAQFDWGGAMEHQTCSSMGASGENTIAHELAHQWWGNLVTCSDFHHIWINEGFATYSEALYWGAKNGEAAYHAHMASKMNSAPGSIYRADTSSVGAIFSYQLVYQKAAWVLHMLRHVTGDDIFFRSLLDYRDQFQFSHASTEDFQSVVEQVSEQDMEWFFDQWIYGSGKPYYEWWWSATELDDNGYSTVTIHIDQVQNSAYPVFKMPIDLKLSSASQEYETIIWDSLRTQQFTVDLDFQPTSAVLDESNWIFKSSNQVAGVDLTLKPGYFEIQQAYPNPFNAEINLLYFTGVSFRGILNIYNLKGELVYTRTVSNDQAGLHQLRWEGVSRVGLRVPSGIYVVQLSSADHESVTQKISLLK